MSDVIPKVDYIPTGHSSKNNTCIQEHNTCNGTNI